MGGGIAHGFLALARKQVFATRTYKACYTNFCLQKLGDLSPLAYNAPYALGLPLGEKKGGIVLIGKGYV